MSTYLLPSGRRVPSATTVIDRVLNQPGIVDWKLRVGLREAGRIGQDARDWGTLLHAAIEAANLDLPFDGGAGAEALEPHLLAYAAWRVEHVAEVVACERVVLSEQFGFGGTLDCLVRLRSGELAILDFKSSKTGPWAGLKPDHAAQLAAYRLALAEEGTIAQRRIVLNLPRNAPGELIEYDYPNHRADTEAFLNLLEIYQWLPTFERRRPLLAQGARP